MPRRSGRVQRDRGELRGPVAVQPPMPIAALLAMQLLGGEAATLNLARASRLAALRSGDTTVRDGAAETIRGLLADDASRVLLYVELALLLDGRAQTEGSRWRMQAGWVLARAREVADDTAAPPRERAMLENAAGVLALHAGDEVGARRAFDRAAALDPTCAPAQLNRGILAAHTHDHDAAIEALETGLRHPSFANDVDGAVALGLTLATRGDLRRAMKILRGAARRSTDPRAAFVLGMVVMDHAIPAAERVAATEHGLYDEARRALSRALALRRASPALQTAAALRLSQIHLRLHPPDGRAMAEDAARELAREHEERAPAETRRLRALEAEMLRDQTSR